MDKPFLTPNPQEFKLYVYWIVGSSQKLSAEFKDCKWIPRIDETLILPIDEEEWHKFKVTDVVYDFKKQCVRVWCKPKDIIPQKNSICREEPSPSPGLYDFEKRAQQELDRVEARQRQEKIERQSRLEQEFARVEMEEVDLELEKLKAEMRQQ
ncbi:PspA/IM30 family protein [Iningainema tapete]|uniref:Uncharacterized protein n=1 Tax=Iningainema tapete BLCC-T55 TaxID=2748662 RepID=A0A8J6XGA6_9CYAN|nr:hypothetical protein [Iningainema tapete]MBD2771169.1 hypothetical protein [Iningainema tapete BLCC-T55]